MFIEGDAGVLVIDQSRPLNADKEAYMQPQFLDTNFHFGPMRCPIQCEGIERGHRRIAEIGVSGSVNPQGFWDVVKDIGSTVIKTAPTWAPWVAAAL